VPGTVKPAVPAPVRYAERNLTAMLPTRVCAILYNMTVEPIRVPTGLTTEGLLGRRYLARAIDSMIIGALAVVVLSVLGGLGPHTGADLLSILLNLFALLIFWIGYGALLESSPWQATLGKRLMGLRVYDSEGGRLKLFQAAGRNLVKDGPFLLFALIPAGRLLSVIWLVATL
jgi:uncharacterized RDD family membrane protein YckC